MGEDLLFLYPLRAAVSTVFRSRACEKDDFGGRFVASVKQSPSPIAVPFPLPDQVASHDNEGGHGRRGMVVNTSGSRFPNIRWILRVPQDV